jgi:hypothetical protein
MLELQKWFFKLQHGTWKAKWPHWDVFDPDTQRQVGVVRLKKFEVTLPEFFRFRWLNLPVEARTVPDDSLVFSLSTPIRLWRPRLQVRNAGGELVGSFKQKWFSIRGGYWVYDGHHRPRGQIHADWSQFEFQWLAPDGQELGRVSRKLVGISRAFLYNERDYLVTASDAIADQPDTKTLLLATALAVSALRG